MEASEPNDKKGTKKLSRDWNVTYTPYSSGERYLVIIGRNKNGTALSNTLKAV